MTLPTRTSPNPQQSSRSIFHQAMTSAISTPPPPPAAATSSAVPPAAAASQKPKDDDTKSNHHTSSHPVDFPIPKLRLEIRDLNHAGAAKFLSSVDAGHCVKEAVDNVVRLLYLPPCSSPSSTSTSSTYHIPPTRSVTLILRPMPGVAYTTGTDLDSDHKEIHFSLSYISNIPSHRLTPEITGVLTHEMVHCYQWNAKGSCPGGLIEGIADWVRLNCDLSPPHWKRETGGKWDGGYQHTAYFLDYLEGRFGDGTVRRMNERLRGRKYEEKEFWTELLGRPVEQLWGDYCEKMKEEETVVVSREDISDEEVRLARREKKDGGEK